MTKRKSLYLIACTTDKFKGINQRAKYIYAKSVLFRLSYLYIKKEYKPKTIYVLSAKYGLISENDLISYYDDNLVNKRKIDRKLWAKNVIKQLDKLMKGKRENYKLICFAGDKYVEFLKKEFLIERPLEKLTIGYQIEWLKKKLSPN